MLRKFPTQYFEGGSVLKKWHEFRKSTTCHGDDHNIAKPGKMRKKTIKKYFLNFTRLQFSSTKLSYFKVFLLQIRIESNDGILGFQSNMSTRLLQNQKILNCPVLNIVVCKLLDSNSQSHIYHFSPKL